MNRLKQVAAIHRLLDSPSVTGVLAAQSLALTRNQVTHFSPYTPLPPLFGRSHDFRFTRNIQRKIYFSTKPKSIVELVLANDWSQGLELELDKSCPSLTHETILYVLNRLDKNPEKAYCFFNWVSEKQWFRPSSSAYSLIVRILANKDTMKQFWVTLKMMKEKGFYLDEETCMTILMLFKKEKMHSDYVALKHFSDRMLQENAMQSVVTKVVGIISGSEWVDEVSNELVKLEIQLSDNFVIRVLKELRSRPSKAYKFFHWAGKQSGFEHNTVTYNAIARVLGRSDSIEEFWSIIEEMKSAGHELDIDTYVKISRQFWKSKMAEDLVKLYELMIDGPYKPSHQDCIILLKSISECDAPNLNLVFRVAKKYESSGHTLSKAIYEGIHSSLKGAGKFDEAENIVQTMRNAGYEPDNIIYSQLIFGLCKMRRLEEAGKVLEEMESCGYIPDIKTWTILIQGHCDANEVDKALLYFAKMIEKGCNPDAVVLGALVDSDLSRKEIEDVYKLLVEMVRKCATTPRQGTYEKLIEKLLGIGKFEEALDLFCLMRKHKYSPFTIPVVQYISKSGTVEDAVKFLKAWSKESPRSRSAYVRVFESFFREGRVSEAQELLCKFCRYKTKHKKIRELFSLVKND